MPRKTSRQAHERPRTQQEQRWRRPARRFRSALSRIVISEGLLLYLSAASAIVIALALRLRSETASPASISPSFATGLPGVQHGVVVRLLKLSASRVPHEFVEQPD